MRVTRSVATILFILLATVFNSAPLVESLQSEDYASPGPRGGYAMVYDSHNQVSVLFGGMSMEGGLHALGDTWFYDYTMNLWTQHSTTSRPPSTWDHAMVYCDEPNLILLYGGGDSTETWSFDCESQTWSRIITDSDPGVHYSHAMAYDSTENVVVLFGGFNEEGRETSETWIFDFATEDWTEVTATTTPVARYGHAMVYDEVSQNVVLCCGNTATQGHQDDTWLFDANQTWTELSTVGEPARLKWTAYTYDSTTRRVVLFGGQINDDATDDLWLYDLELNTWTEASPDVSPPSRINCELAYDESNNVYVTHGGFNQEYGLYGDTWVYDPAENTWIEMGGISTSTGTGPGDLLVVVLIALPIVALVTLVIVYLRRR